MFSVDYFFPTNFPPFNDASVSAGEVQKIVVTELRKLLTRYDYIIIPTLFERKDLSSHLQARVDNAGFESIKFIEGKLNETGLKTDKTEIINRTLRDFSAQHPRQVRVMESSTFFNKVIANNGLVRPGMEWNISAKSLFAKDLIHLTDHGQTALFNYSLKSELAQMMEFRNVKIPEMPVEWTYGKAWRSSIIKIIARTPAEFGNNVAGDYWGRVTSTDAFYAKAAKLKEVTQGQYKQALQHLTGIQSTIGWLVFSGGATPEHFIARSTDTAGHRVLTMDLSKTIFFTNIDLKESESQPGTFIGYGYDYWSSVKGSPVTNYKFTVKEVTPTKLNVVWELFPIFVDETGRRQTHALERVALKDQHWIDYLERNQNAIPSLTYTYEVDIIDE